MIKSIIAVVVGFFTVVILSIATDALLEAAGVFPPQSQPGLYVTWMLALALTYRIVYTIAGGYVTAWLAPQNQMKHVTILGIIGIVGGAVGVVFGWNLSPHWYCIAILVTAFPCTWLGGKLKKVKIMPTNTSTILKSH